MHLREVRFLWLQNPGKGQLGSPQTGRQARGQRSRPPAAGVHSTRLGTAHRPPVESSMAVRPWPSGARPRHRRVASSLESLNVGFHALPVAMPSWPLIVPTCDWPIGRHLSMSLRPAGLVSKLPGSSPLPISQRRADWEKVECSFLAQLYK